MVFECSHNPREGELLVQAARKEAAGGNTAGLLKAVEKLEEAYKIDDGADRARIPLTMAVLQRMGVEWSDELAALAAPPVLGGGTRVGVIRVIPGAVPPGD